MLWFRIIASIILLFAILFMPFWLSIIIALASMIYFSYYWEGVLLFLLSDLLYGVKEIKFYDTYFISFVISFLILMTIETIKKKTRISKK